jgi:hypothetical protein
MKDSYKTWYGCHGNNFHASKCPTSHNAKHQPRKPQNCFLEFTKTVQSRIRIGSLNLEDIRYFLLLECKVLNLLHTTRIITAHFQHSNHGDNAVTKSK